MIRNVFQAMGSKSRRSSRRFLSTLLSTALLAAFALLLEFLAPMQPAYTPVFSGESLCELHIIDVGQGSSALLRAGDKTVLIDAGEVQFGQTVLDYLDRQQIDSLDLLVLTHLHTDHFGGAIRLLEEINADVVWMPLTPDGQLPTNSSYKKLCEALEQSDSILEYKTDPEKFVLSEQVTLSLLGPFLADPSDLNDSSLCLRIDAGDCSALITGDGETAVEDALRLGGAPIDVDVLVAGHHGSNSSSKKYFLDAVTPLVSAVSAGRDNPYNLPNQKALERLLQHGPVYRTDLCGDIVFETDGASLRISAEEVDSTIDVRG